MLIARASDESGSVGVHEYGEGTEIHISLQERLSATRIAEQLTPGS